MLRVIQGWVANRVVEAWRLGGYAPGGEEVRGYGGVEKSRATLLTLLPIRTYLKVPSKSEQRNGMVISALKESSSLGDLLVVVIEAQCSCVLGVLFICSGVKRYFFRNNFRSIKI